MNITQLYGAAQASAVGSGSAEEAAKTITFTGQLFVRVQLTDSGASQAGADHI